MLAVPRSLEQTAVQNSFHGKGMSQNISLSRADSSKYSEEYW